MNIFPAFQTILYTVSTAMLYPVVILLIFLCLWIILYAGAFRGRSRKDGDVFGAIGIWRISWRILKRRDSCLLSWLKICRWVLPPMQMN